MLQHLAVKSTEVMSIFM